MIWQLLHTIEAALHARNQDLEEHVTLYKDLSVRIGKGPRKPLIISRDPRDVSHYSKKPTIEWEVWKKRVVRRFVNAKGKGFYRHEEDYFIFLEFIKDL